MKLLLIRHAIAAELVPGSGGIDADRPLTREGIRRFQAGVRGLRALKLIPEIIFASPFRRARETAELLQEGSKHPIELHLTEALLPDAALVLPTQLLKLTGIETVALVGHNPYLEGIVASIVAPEAPGTVHLTLKKGSCVVLELAGTPELPHASLVALLPPRLLRTLGGDV